MELMNLDDNNPKCFKVDYNNNQLEVSYGKDTTFFPVIIDEDVDDDGNVILNNSTDDTDDFDELTDELNRNIYQRNFNPILKASNDANTNNNNKIEKFVDLDRKSNVVAKIDDDYEDEMFKSLRRMSNTYDALNKQGRFSTSSSIANRKMSVIPFQPNATKELTFLINEIYFTNGKSSIELIQRTNKFQTKFFSRKKICTKSVRCIGTSLKNCVASDIITIDIDENSTLLPMMCKLMIIIEGAVVERGRPVLVRDCAVQVNLTGNNKNGVLDDDAFEEKKKVSFNDDTDDRDYNEDDDDDDDEDTYESNFINESKSHYLKFNRINNMKKKYKRNSNISGRRDSYYRRQSYFNLNEYSSVPYYQYQRMNSDSINNSKNNVESMTEDYYLTANNNIMIINSTSTPKERSVNIPIELKRKEVIHSYTTSTVTNYKNKELTKAKADEDEEEIEISIPIKIERYNSGPLKVNHGIYKFKTNNNRRKTVYEETYNRFEAEITTYNKPMRTTGGSPVVYTFYSGNNNNNNSSGTNSANESEPKQPIVKIEDARSVTQVFLSKLVDGNLKQ